MSTNILIIGGGGFIGSHVAEYYIKNNFNVTVIDNFLTGRQENLVNLINLDNFKLVAEDFLELDKAEKLLLIANANYIYNFAAIVGIEHVLKNPLKTINVNTRILTEILEISAKLINKPTILTASTSEVYGSQEGALSEKNSPAIIENTLKYHSSYPISKLLNENLSSIYFQEKNVPIIILRLFNTIGPRQIGKYGMVVPRFIKSAINNTPIMVHGDGTQTRSFCDVRDIAKMLFDLSVQQDALGKIFNIGNEQTISIMDLAVLVKKLCGSSSSIVKISFKEYYGDQLKNYVNIKHRRPNLEKLKKIISIQYSWNLSDTIKDMAELLS